MSEVIDRPASGDRKIALNGEFLKVQAIDAVETFFVPLIGIYAAAKGKKVTVGGRRPKKKAA